MEELKVDLRKLNTDDDIKSYYAEVKSIRSSKIDYDKTYIEPSNRPTNLKDKFEQCLKESGKRQEIQNEWMKKIMISTDLSLKNHDSSIKKVRAKIKRCILKENKEPTTTHDKLKQQLQKVVSHEIKKLPAHYSATLQNKLPPKEIDPVSFILPCIIGNHSMSNALADLGASISIMPYSLFKRLGLGSLKPIKMTIKMADRSMQSPKGIKENVLVKSSNFMFPVDFIVLDIMEDENVPIILGINMVGLAKNLHVFIGNHQFLVDFIILENISEFVEKGLTKVLFGHLFKEQIGLVEDRGKGTLWFKIGNDKIIFHMLRAEKAFTKLTVKQHNSMGPLLKVSDEDKKRGIHKPEKKIKGFYRGCLTLGNEYKYDQEVVDWIRGCINDGMT
ncbi:homeodomain-like protein [Tanacetum coccineum]